MKGVSYNQLVAGVPGQQRLRPIARVTFDISIDALEWVWNPFSSITSGPSQLWEANFPE